MMNQKYKYSLILNILYLISTIDSLIKIPKIIRFDEGLNEPICGLTNVLDLIVTKWESDCYDNKCCRNPYEVETYIKNRRKTGPKTRIYKGKHIDNTESPWTVHLKPMKWHGFDYQTCSGVLITLEWVLTAAHCFEEWKFSTDWFDYSITITAGSNITKDFTDGLQMRTNTNNKWYSHYKYIVPESGETQNRTEDELKRIKNLYDIALFKVSKPFTRIVDKSKQKYRINTICLPQKMSNEELNRDFNRRQMATVYGFSDLLPNKRSVGQSTKFGKTNGLLRSGFVKLKAYNDCGLSKIFCSDSYKGEPRGCDGDSGGPLVQHFPNTVDGKQQKAILICILRSTSSDNDIDCGNEIFKTN